MAIPVVFLLLTLAVTSHAARPTNPIRLVSADGADPTTTAPLPLQKPKSVSASQINCPSWRLSVEANNTRDWDVVPAACKYYIAHYMTGGQYEADCEFVADEAIAYAESLTLSGTGKEIWIFDISETVLSNLPYYSRDTVQFGALPFNSTAFNEWVLTGQATAVPGVLRLFNSLSNLGIRVIFLTETRNTHANREAVISNIAKVGYRNINGSIIGLIFKDVNDQRSTKEYKATTRGLLAMVYVIVGNIGDQWRDLEGAYADRTFKLPNPMYFLS